MTLPRRILTAWLLAATLVPAAAARGDDAAGRVLAGPVLSGDEVVWVKAAGRSAEVRASSPAGDRELATVRPAGTNEHMRVDGLAGSPRGVAVTLRSGDASSRLPSIYSALQTFVGPPGGGLREVARCEPPDGDLRPTAAAMGDVAAFQSVACAPPEYDRIRLWAPDGIEQPAPPSGDARLVAAAGRFVAWATDVFADVTVYDRERAAVAYVARPGALGHFRTVALAEDGRLAVTFVAERGGSDAGVAVFPADGGPPRVVGSLRVMEPQAMRFSGDRVAVSHGFLTARARLEIVDVAADRVQATTRLLQPGQFDIRGDRFAWVARSCAGPRIRTVTLPASLGVPRRQCAVPLARRPRLDGRRLDLRFECARFDSSQCSGVVTAHLLRRGRRARLVGTSSFERAREVVRVEGGRATRRAIRRGGARLRLTVVADRGRDKRRSVFAGSRL